MARERNTHIYGILRERDRKKERDRESIKLNFIAESKISEANLWQKCNNLHNDKTKIIIKKNKKKQSSL